MQPVLLNVIAYSIAGKKRLNKIVATTRPLTSEFLIIISVNSTLKLQYNLIRLGNGIKRKRASSGNVADTAYCSTHYEGMGSQHHLTGGLMLDCGDNGREGELCFPN